MSSFRMFVVSVVASALWLGAGAASAQNRPVTDQCTTMRAMQWLANVTDLDRIGHEMIDQRERIACGAGVEAGPSEVWPNNITLRAGDVWYYPSGVTYVGGGSWFYPNGVTFATTAGAYYYPNGVAMFAGSTWYLPNGTPSSESGLLQQALTRLPRARADQLMAIRNAEGTPFWRMVYLMTMAWEAR